MIGARRRQFAYRFVLAFVLGLATVVTAVSSLARVDAQSLNPCALLTSDDIQPLADSGSVPDGSPKSFEALGSVRCRYSWGAGVKRFTLDVVASDASRMFPGASPDQIKQRLLESIRAGTADAVVSGIGEAAVFKPESAVYAVATALVNGRILSVQADGIFAGEKKDQVIELLKLAASRL